MYNVFFGFFLLSHFLDVDGIDGIDGVDEF